jgi:hypothetical protein
VGRVVVVLGRVVVVLGRVVVVLGRVAVVVGLVAVRIDLVEGRTVEVVDGVGCDLIQLSMHGCSISRNNQCRP